MDQKLQQKIKELAQPTLDDLQLPSPITGVVLESISFGQSPPFIEGCRALREKWEDNRNLEVNLFLKCMVFLFRANVRTHKLNYFFSFHAICISDVRTSTWTTDRLQGV